MNVAPAGHEQPLVADADTIFLDCITNRDENLFRERTVQLATPIIELQRQKRTVTADCEKLAFSEWINQRTASRFDFAERTRSPQQQQQADTPFRHHDLCRDRIHDHTSTPGVRFQQAPSESG